jgi:integrase
LQYLYFMRNIAHNSLRKDEDTIDMKQRPERKDMMSPIRIQKGLAKVGIYHVINRDEWLHFQVIWREAGKMRRKQFPTLDEAKAYAEEQADRLANGSGLLVPVPRKEIARYRSLENMLGTKVTLEDIVQQWVAKKSHFHPGTQDTKAIVAEYLKHRTKDKEVLLKFSLFFEPVPFSSIIALDIERFVKDQNWTGNQSRLDALHALQALFDWAKERGYLAPTTHTAAEQALDAQEITEILSPEELRTILKNVPKQDIPLVALSAYGGFSLQQIAMLRWEDINWSSKTLDLQALQMKEPLKLSEGITKMLQRYRKPKGPLKQDLTPQNLRRVAIRSGIKHWKPRILTRSSRIYTQLKENPDNQEITGIESKDAEKWFEVLDTLGQSSS